MRRPLLLLSLLAAFATAATGCGNKEPETTDAETEGIWVDAGPLDYHIQGSRQLNPFEVPDDRYLSGLPDDYEEPKADETWFAVFLRIENKTDEPAPTPEEFEIEDTQGEVYTPVPLDPEANPYVYEPTELGKNEVVPHPDSSQELNSTAGTMLLFKLPLENYENRPLEFIIHAPEGSEGPPEAQLALDV